MKHLVKISDMSLIELEEILNLAKKLQREKEEKGYIEPYLRGKNVSMIFEKPSLRTHAAFDIAVSDLGGHSVYYDQKGLLRDAVGKERESLSDVIKNLELFTDAIVARVFSHDTIETIAKQSQVPVINALCDKYHPTQAICDIYAIKEHFKSFEGLKVAWVGDGNNVATSLAQMCSLVGIKFSIATPKGFEIPNEETRELNGFSESNDPEEAVKNANVITTDTWISMGQEEEESERKRVFLPFQVNQTLMLKASPNAVFMHCLPAHRGYEVTQDVIDGSQSIVFKQAVSRLYIARALLIKLIK